MDASWPVCEPPAPEALGLKALRGDARCDPSVHPQAPGVQHGAGAGPASPSDPAGAPLLKASSGAAQQGTGRALGLQGGRAACP